MISILKIVSLLSYNQHFWKALQNSSDYAGRWVGCKQHFFNKTKHQKNLKFETKIKPVEGLNAAGQWISSNPQLIGQALKHWLSP